MHRVPREHRQGVTYSICKTQNISFFKISYHLAVFKNELTIFQFETSKDISDRAASSIPEIKMGGEKTVRSGKEQCLL